MQFQMLGPMEAVRDGMPVGLGGIRQRATLGFLLLQPNRVVATSTLLKALWPMDDAPTSARKILQNAVWGLRGVLSPGGGTDGSVALLTQAPGYMLRVDVEQVDAFRFQHRVAHGRGELAAGRAASAATLLREALALWRGPALADLAEVGIVWSETAALQNTRLVAMEEYFEAELALGRHHAILSQLEAMVEAHPLRERLCGQLMLALYCCGRQADALNVFARVRSALVESLGLEPGHGLRSLQHAILTHDPMLAAGKPHLETVSVSTATPIRTLVSLDQHLPTLDEEIEAVQGTAATVEPAAGTRSRVSAVMIRTRRDLDRAGTDGRSVDETLERAAQTIREVVESFGGVLAASLGSVSLALFGVSGRDAKAPSSAVSASLEIRERLSGTIDTGEQAQACSLANHLVVVTGEALVRQPPEGAGPPAVNGSLLDECYTLLSSVPGGEIYACDETRRLTETLFVYREGVAADDASGWRIEGFREAEISCRQTPIVDREGEIDLLCHLLDRTRHRAAPHLVTVVGEPGTGKTACAQEFERRAAAEAPDTQFLQCGVSSVCAEDDAMVFIADVVAACCGIVPSDSLAVARAKLTTTVLRLLAGEENPTQVLARLMPLIDGGYVVVCHMDIRGLLETVRLLLEKRAAESPFVVVIDDLDRAHDVLLDFVENLADSASPSPLLILATAQPKLLDRRPTWGGGKRHAATITLDPVDRGRRAVAAISVPEQRQRATGKGGRCRRCTAR